MKCLISDPPLEFRIIYALRSVMERTGIFRALSILEKYRETAFLRIAGRIMEPGSDTSMIHYDVTSSYFKGREDNDLVLFGYSRDKKRGKEQIVTGLVMADGLPIYHEVCPGNTIDPKTLERTISTLSERYHIKKTIVIADRHLVVILP